MTSRAFNNAELSTDAKVILPGGAPTAGGQTMVAQAPGNGQLIWADVGNGILRFIGVHTPTVPVPYPIPATLDAGNYWTVNGLGAPFTFTSGSLNGQSVSNNDQMIWNGVIWVKNAGAAVSLTGYAKSDGSVPMTGTMSVGGFGFTNVGPLGDVIIDAGIEP